MQAALSATPAVLTVELPHTEVANGVQPPEPLSRDAAEILGQAVAADLHRILGDAVTDAGLIVSAALYDLTELLQPGLPMTEALLDIYRGSLRGGPFIAQRLSLGSARGRFPAGALEPRRAPGAGPLLALPFALVAPGPSLDPVRALLEERLLERGSASLATDQVVRQQFGLAPVNLAYATFHDLSALLKVQLEHARFAPLWQLLEAALYRPDEPVVVETGTGQRLLGLHGEVWSPFLTLDEWLAGRGDGDIEGYGEYIQGFRQYTAGLRAHGLVFTATLPQEGVYAADPEIAISVARAAALPDAGIRHQDVDGERETPAAAAITLTEQRLPGIGPFAYTILAQRDNGGLAYLGHDYPLAPEAINTIREHWQQTAHRLGASFQLERPQRPITGGEPPRLLPWLDYQGSA
ncbi:hypothetical protein [Arhodomonas sp. SL1]|uniref:hypothetical protein n=1 Tax=Arhodomonas sp. SL1 TaxID=3425691 RepID=UPI003F880C71